MIPSVRGRYRTVGTIILDIARDVEAIEDLSERTRHNVRDLTTRLVRRRARQRSQHDLPEAA